MLAIPIDMKSPGTGEVPPPPGIRRERGGRGRFSGCGVVAGRVVQVIVALVVLASASGVGAADAAFECEISTDRTNLVIGQVPSLTVRIRNKTGGEVHLVGSLDGSTCGWRFPKCRLEILDPAGRSVALPLGRCGNMNALRTDDFVRVRAGDSFYPFGLGFFRPSEFSRFPVTTPGEYTVRFHYTTSDRLQDYFGDERRRVGTQVSPEIQRLFEKVPKLELQSNSLKLHFTAKPSRR